MRSLLIIGAGKEQIPAYVLAKNMGLFVIGTDQNSDAPAFSLSDKKLICSTRNVSETLDAVIDFTKTNTIDGVMTIANDVPLTVSTIAKHLNLPSISIESAKAASNKSIMKNKFIEFGIPTPNFQIFNQKNDFTDSLPFEFPFILKPSDGRGSRGVLLVDKNTDLSWAWQHSIKNSENKVILLEEFIEGDQLSVEGIFINKKFHGIAYADRNYQNLKSTKPFIVEDGGSIPSKYDDKLLTSISGIVEKAAISLGIQWGSVKADVVLSQRGPMIIEIAARLSGNYLATHHIPMAYGIDIVSTVIRLSLGEKIDPLSLKPKFKKFLGVRYFFPPQGKINDILGIKEVEQLPYTRFLDIFRKKGDIQSVIDSHVSRAGTIVCEGNTYDEAIKRTEDAVQKIHFSVQDF